MNKPNSNTSVFRASAFPFSLWILLWVNLNTGFWNFETPSSSESWLLLIRASLPLLILPACILIFSSQKNLRLPANSPSRLLFVYGVCAALSSIFSPAPGASVYWSVTFLSTILVAWIVVNSPSPLHAARLLVHLTWVATFIVAAILGYLARNSIFGAGASAYGDVMTDLAGASRSSGVARWAAVPGLVAVVRIFYTRRRVLIAVYAVVALVSFYIVYRMQSRGAVFGAAAALLFVGLLSSRMRRYALPVAVMSFILVILIETPELVSERVTDYLKRGQSQEAFMSMTGRTRAYEHGMTAFAESPIFGRGQWADRLTIGEHVHNSYLQAFMNAGVIGGVPYLISWISGWFLLYKVQKRSTSLKPEDRLCVIEAGTVMMFFTVRAIPETTTASFAVDLLVMVAVYVYLETVVMSLRCQPARGRLSQAIPMPSGSIPSIANHR